MFCDLVGSTALSSRLDPEDMREVLRAYQDACSSVIARYDGYVAKFMGDGVYAYFGYPRAHEDDAERAITAGLGIVEAVGALEHDLQVRIGVATGTVAVGDIVGEGASEEAAIVGEAPNLAGRLQEIAEPDTVVIGEATHALAGGLFETIDLGQHDLKGFAEAVGAWAVVRLRRTDSRFEAIHGERLSALVGRDEEMEIIERRWERAKAGEGQVVLISGEPGIGKSRLVHAISRSLAGQTHWPLRIQCSPYYANSAMHPFIANLEAVIGPARDDDPSARLDKLVSWIAEAGQAPEALAPLIGPYLGIDTAERFPPPDVSPQQQKELLLEALAERLRLTAAKVPTLMVVEDAHWIDPTSAELLGRHVERSQDVALLIMVTYRPEFAAPWVGLSNATLIALNRLTRQECVALIAGVAGGGALPRPVIDQIAERTDGVPLFIEELTKAMAESGEALSAAAIPTTLQDALEARLDRLGDAREIAQIGAVIGRDFAYDLLAGVTGVDEDDMRNRLDSLVGSELVSCRGEPPEATYTFKHALLQDTAYNSLLRRRREELHGRIAEILERQFPDRAAAEPEVVAHHFTAADRPREAIRYWYNAGQQANARSANREAISHFERGITLLHGLSPEYDRDDRELDFQINLAAASIAARGYAQDETEAAYLRARDLLTTVGHDERQFAVLHGLFVVQTNLARLDAAEEVAQDLLDRALANDDQIPILVGHRALAVAYNALGKFDLAYRESSAATALYDPEGHRESALIYGHDVGVAAGMHMALSSWYLGYPDRSMNEAAWAFALAERLEHANTLGYAHLWYVFIHLLAHEFETTRVWAEAMVRLGDEKSMALWSGWGRCLLGCALACLGRAEEALAHFAAGREIIARVRSFMLRPTFGCFEAIAHEDLGHHDEALAIIDSLEGVVSETGERWYLPEVHRIRASLRNGAAESDLIRAIEVAKDMGSRIFELRAATDFARLRHSQGESSEARKLLIPLYSRFTEGFDTADLKEAKALLDQLSWPLKLQLANLRYVRYCHQADQLAQPRIWSRSEHTTANQPGWCLNLVSWIRSSLH